MPPKRGSGGAKLKLSDAAVKTLRDWLFAAENWDHPYPTQEEKQDLLARTGITPKQLTNWLTNARKRLWMPLRKKQGKAITNYAEAKRVKRFEEWDKMTRSASNAADSVVRAPTAAQPHADPSFQQQQQYSQHMRVHSIAGHPVSSGIAGSATSNLGGGGGDMAILAQAAAAAAKGAPVSTVLAPFNVVPRFSAADSLYPGAAGPSASGPASATTAATESSGAGPRRSRRAKRSFSETDSRDDASSPSGNALSTATDSEIATITSSSDPVVARIWHRARDSASLAEAVAEEAAASTQVGLVGGSAMPGGHGGSSTVVERGIITRLRADIETQQMALKRHQELIDSRKQALQRAMLIANMTPAPVGAAPPAACAPIPTTTLTGSAQLSGWGGTVPRSEEARVASGSHESSQPRAMPASAPSSSAPSSSEPSSSSASSATLTSEPPARAHPAAPPLYADAGLEQPQHPPLPIPPGLPTEAYSAASSRQQPHRAPSLHSHMRSGSFTGLDEGLHRHQFQTLQPSPYGGPDALTRNSLSARPSPALSRVGSTSDMKRHPSHVAAGASAAPTISDTHNLEGRASLGTGFSSGLPRVRSNVDSRSQSMAAVSAQSAAQESWVSAPASSALVPSPQASRPSGGLDAAGGSLSEEAAASLAQMAEFPTQH